jgi:hypothetical protein
VIRDLSWWIVLLLMTLFQGSILSSSLMSSLFASCRYSFTSHSTFYSLTFPNVLQPGHLGHCLPRVHMLPLPVHSGRRGVLKLRLRPPIQLCPSRCKAHRYKVLTVHRCGCSWGRWGASEGFYPQHSGTANRRGCYARKCYARVQEMPFGKEVGSNPR